MIARVAFFVIALGSVYMLPWWSSLSIAILLTWRFTKFYEGIFLGLAMDVLYITPTIGLPFSFQFPFTLLMLLVFLSFRLLHMQLRVE